MLSRGHVLLSYRIRKDMNIEYTYIQRVSFPFFFLAQFSKVTRSIPMSSRQTQWEKTSPLLSRYPGGVDTLKEERPSTVSQHAQARQKPGHGTLLCTKISLGPGLISRQPDISGIGLRHAHTVGGVGSRRGKKKTKSLLALLEHKDCLNLVLSGGSSLVCAIFSRCLLSPVDYSYSRGNSR